MDEANVTADKMFADIGYDKSEIRMDLIGREDAIRHLNECADRTEKIGHTVYARMFRKAAKELEKVPAAMEFVRHGHWVVFDDGEDDGIFCSVCKSDLLDSVAAVHTYSLPKRCPVCGAMMDEEQL